jgi:lantibiotic modifying enzyme
MTTRAGRYLDGGRQTARWLAGTAIDKPDGTIWPASPDWPAELSPALYGGSAGIALFLADLARLTGDSGHGRAARDAERFTARTSHKDRFGLYSGLAGAALAVDDVATVLDDASLRIEAYAMLAELAAAAQPAGAGVEWPAWPDGRGPWRDLFHGSAGIALALARLGRIDEAVAAGRRLTELSIPADSGRWWRSRPDDLRPAPNIAHGTVGIAYALASLASITGDAGMRAAAVAGGTHLLSIARTDAGTCAVHHHEPDGTDLYTLGFCSGPPGLACLFIRLSQLTCDPAWLEWAERAALAVSASGIPARPHPGFWDNVGQCCGSAGVADFFIGMHALTGRPDDLEFGCQMLDDILGRAVVDETGMRWHNIEHTATPPELPAQTGWMQGAAGIGAALLRGHRVLTGAGAGPWLPTWPFPD